MFFTFTTVVIETSVLFICYRLFFFKLLKDYLEQLYSTASWWDYLTKYHGMFTEDTQIEIVYVSLLGAHHFLGGFVMLCAYVFDDPTLFAHGLIWELVDDLHDMMCMMFLWWPFDKRRNQMMIVMGLHHLAGMIIIVPAVTTELHMDSHLQLAVLALLFAGSGTCLIIVLSRTMDRRIAREAFMDFFLWIANGLLFSFCRFYILPWQLYKFYENCDWNSFPTKLKYPLAAATTFMMIFNIWIIIEGSKGTISRLYIALNSNGMNILYNPRKWFRTVHCD